MTPLRKTRVMIVEDSSVVRALLEYIITADPRLELAASVATGEEAVALAARLKPDVISLDIRLPGIDGFETTHRIMRESPTPIVVVSGSIENEDLRIAMEALNAGALAVIEKPVAPTREGFAAIADKLCGTLIAMADVKVVRQLRRSTGRAAKATPELPEATPASSQSPRYPIGIVALVASTGGPRALARVISGLGQVEVPIVVVQHITNAFVGGFATWLGQSTAADVTLAADGMVMRPGRVHVAPGGVHLVVDHATLNTVAGATGRGHLPSGDMLLESIAKSFGGHAIGVVLTGMGDDGADGLLAMRRAGAYTIAESGTTAAVFGMPRVAIERGAAVAQLPLDAIATRIRALLREPVESF
jgi:two-component system chemotaxis response regulator CheB